MLGSTELWFICTARHETDLTDTRLWSSRQHSPASRDTGERPRSLSHVAPSALEMPSSCNEDPRFRPQLNRYPERSVWSPSDTGAQSQERSWCTSVFAGSLSVTEHGSFSTPSLSSPGSPGCSSHREKKDCADLCHRLLDLCQHATLAASGRIRSRCSTRFVGDPPGHRG